MSGELIDDTDQKNLAFYLIKKDKSEGKKNNQLLTSEEKKDSPVNKSKNILYDLETQLKEQQLEKLEVDTRIQLLKEEKIKGEIIPILLVNAVFTQHCQSLLHSMRDCIESMIIEFSAVKRFSSEDSALLRGKMVTHLNHAMDQAVNISQKNIKTIIENHSETRNPGEKINS